MPEYTSLNKADDGLLIAMTAQLIDGKAIAAQLAPADSSPCCRTSNARAAHTGPGRHSWLEAIRPHRCMSRINVKIAKRSAFISKAYDLPAQTSQSNLEKLIDQLNEDPNMDGILLQLPLPGASGRFLSAGAHPSGQRRGWFPSVQYRPTGPAYSTAASMHARRASWRCWNLPGSICTGSMRSSSVPRISWVDRWPWSYCYLQAAR